MSTFHFKHFDVANDSSAMKVGTDGVILGAAATVSPRDRRVLDAGTGTGLIALMLAQRYSEPRPFITGIDIDAPSAAEAAANFSASPWSDCLEAAHCPLEGYLPMSDLDLIVSNPPYFQNSLLPPLPGRTQARHVSGDAMGFLDLAAFAQEHLSESGRLSVILPYDQRTGTLRVAASFGLYPFRILSVKTSERKAPSRFVAEFSRERVACPQEEMMVIGDEKYSLLTGDFYLDK